MWPWIFILIVPFFMHVAKKHVLVLGNRQGTRLSVNIGWLFAFVLLFVFRGFRADSVGGDLEVYKDLFYYTGTLPWNLALKYPGYEKGFLILIRVLYAICPHFQVLLIFSSVLFTFALLKFIYNNSEMPELSLYIYITMMFMGASFNNERQAIAISFLLLGFEYIKKRKMGYFLFFVALASLFHVTSLAFIVLYFMYSIRITRKYWTTMLCGGIFFYAFSSDILRIITENIYTKYQGVNSPGGGYSYFFILLLFDVVAFYISSRDVTVGNEKKLFIHMLLIATIIQMFSFHVGFAYRLTRVFSVAMIIFIPDAIKSFKREESRRVLTVAVYVLLFIYYILELSRETIGLVPYVMMKG